MSKIDATVTRFKDVSDGFISMKRELKEDVGSQRELSFDYFMYYTRYRFNRDDSEGSTDMVSFVKALGNNMLDGGLSAKIAKFSKAMDDMILVRGDIGLQEYMSNYSLGLCVVTKDEYEREYESTGGGKAPKGLSVTYPLLHFAQATGWHNFLKINDWRPVIWNSETKEFEEVPM